MATHEDLVTRFAYHRPTNGKVKRHEDARFACFQAAMKLNELLPEGREKALVLTKLEEAMMWANAAIAREDTT